MNWEKLKKAFEDFHVGKISKNELIAVIRLYQQFNNKGKSYG